ncbi:MAG: hypothetical protein ACR2RD_03820 [Woeseiaceae bacterium]
MTSKNDAQIAVFAVFFKRNYNPAGERPGVASNPTDPVELMPFPFDQVDPMNKTIIFIFYAIIFLFATEAFACDYPHRANVPDGNIASKDEMIEGQRGVKAYMSAMETYLSCIEAAEQETVAGSDDVDEATKQQRIEMYNKKYNAAVDEMNLVAEEFNVQVRAYKERSQ